jgi:hypothetical protein
MKRVSTQLIGTALDDYFGQNPEIANKLAEVRLISAWKIVLGPSISRFTDNLYIKKRTLYVKFSSSVLKSELLICREQLVKKLNDEAGMEVIDSITLI